MTTNATDDTDGMVTGDEEFVIYDRENHQAWIQSTVAVTVADRR